MKEKYKLNVAFGENEADSAETLGFVNENKDLWKIKTFNTEAERNAYIQGVEDMNGWLAVYWEKAN